MAAMIPKNVQDDLLRRHLSTQYTRMLDVLADYRQTGDPESLHNARISIRRFRGLLKLFRKPLQTTSAKKVSVGLGSLLKLLGTVRDHDVWIKSLEQIEKELQLSKEEAWVAFLGDQSVVGQSIHRKTRDILRGKRALNALDPAKALLLSEAAGKVAGGVTGFADFLAVKIYKSVRHLLKVHNSLEGVSDVQLHRFRRKCRCIRYWTEFARPYLGKSGTPFLKSFQKISTVLGEVRDAANMKQRLQGIQLTCIPSMIKLLDRRQKRAMQAFHKEWQACRRKQDRVGKLCRKALKRSKKQLQRCLLMPPLEPLAIPGCRKPMVRRSAFLNSAEYHGRIVESHGDK